MLHGSVGWYLLIRNSCRVPVPDAGTIRLHGGSSPPFFVSARSSEIPSSPRAPRNDKGRVLQHAVEKGFLAAFGKLPMNRQRTWRRNSRQRKAPSRPPATLPAPPVGRGAHAAGLGASCCRGFNRRGVNRFTGPSNRRRARVALRVRENRNTIGEEIHAEPVEAWGGVFQQPVRSAVLDTAFRTT